MPYYIDKEIKIIQSSKTNHDIYYVKANGFQTTIS